MASDLLLTGCSTEGDLAVVAQGILDQAATVRDQLIAEINAINATSVQETLNSLNTLYDQIISPYSNTDISNQVGLLPTLPSQSDIESQLEPLGLILVNGVIWMGGTDSNIQNFRELFFALGSDLKMFLSVLNSNSNPIVVQTQLTVQQLPNTQPSWTTDQAIAFTKNNSIEAVYTASDGFSYVIVPTFLAINQSAAQTALQFSVPQDQIITQVFWLNQANITSATINNLTAIGLNSDQIAAVLTSQSVKAVDPTTLETTRVSSDQMVATALSQINLLSSRFSTTNAASIASLRTEIVQSITSNQTILYNIQQQVRFNPIVITDPADIAVFLTRNTEADLVYLFANRRSVTSINFKATQTQLIEALQSAGNIPVGSNTVSTILINENAPTLDPDINQTNLSMAQNSCALFAMQQNGPLQYSSLISANNCLSSISIRPQATTTTTTTSPGYANYADPSSIIVMQSNLTITLDLTALFNAVLATLAPLTTALSEAVKILVSTLKGLQSAILAVLAPLQAKIAGIVSQVQAFLSRNGSYFGTISLATSILNCLFGLDLSLGLPSITALLDSAKLLIGKLQSALILLINQIRAVVDGFINNLVCLPSQLLGNFLKAETCGLAAIVSFPNLLAPFQTLEAALNNLLSALQAEVSLFTNFGFSLLHLQIPVITLNINLNNFQNSISCNQTQNNSSFATLFGKSAG